MELHNSFAAVTLEQIQGLEHELGIHLPDHYVDFLLKNNGGRPKPNGFSYISQVDKEFHKGMIDWFLGVHTGKHDDFQEYYEIYKNRIPRGSIAIAHDPGGNLICLSLKDETVYFWDHNEEVEEGEIPDYRNVYKITDNFSHFLFSLKDFDK
jgi:hypothetical protein